MSSQILLTGVDINRTNKKDIVEAESKLEVKDIKRKKEEEKKEVIQKRNLELQKEAKRQAEKRREFERKKEQETKREMERKKKEKGVEIIEEFFQPENTENRGFEEADKAWVAKPAQKSQFYGSQGASLGSRIGEESKFLKFTNKKIKSKVERIYEKLPLLQEEDENCEESEHQEIVKKHKEKINKELRDLERQKNFHSEVEMKEVNTFYGRSSWQ